MNKEKIVAVIAASLSIWNNKIYFIDEAAQVRFIINTMVKNKSKNC
jgi:hypothetical protein